jgi:hypothetical protein
MHYDTQEGAEPKARSALILAHPGHELLLHHWIERARPLVFTLTDGSGGAAANRLSYSQVLLERCGARPGQAFGVAADKEWYRAILSGDAALLNDTVGAIAADCAAENVAHIVCDPVELFNPVHDLANAAAHAVARRLSRAGKPAAVSTYPIENDRAHDPAWRLLLNEDAAARKLAAVAAYTPLAHERKRYEALIARRYELIAPDAPMFAWPARLEAEPFYEQFGRKRLQQHRYSDLITYARHVRPLAAQALELRAAA